MRRPRLQTAGLALLTLAAGGCVAAAAGAGAAAGIYYSDRGAEAQINAPVASTYTAAAQTFQDMGITQTKTSSQTEDNIESRELDGTTSDRNIEVHLKEQGAGTHVEVVAKKSEVTWDKEMAKQILSQIAGKAGGVTTSAETP